MLAYIDTEEGTCSFVRAETLIQAISYFQRTHPGTTVVKAVRANNLKLVLKGCHDTVERQLEALLTAIESIDDDGAVERALQEYVYLDCVGTECAEFVETEEEE